MTEIDDFPYKRLTFNPSQMDIELGLQQTIIRQADGLSTLTLPEGYEWKYKNIKNLACVTSDEAYNNVNKLTDYFSEPARIRANVKGYPSVLEYWHQNKYIIKKQYTDVYNLREYIFKNTKEATLFKISATYALLNYLGSEKVLDPSAGWGDRLLGACFAPGVKVYNGIDPNSALTEPYQDMLSYMGLTQYNVNFNVLTQDFLKVIVPDSYDTVFTSPPFYDFEIYSDESSQSITGINSFEEWINKFYAPYLTKAYSSLTKEGKMCLYVSDNNTIRGFTNATINIMNKLGAKYEGVIAIVNADLKRPFPLWIWSKP